MNARLVPAIAISAAMLSLMAIATMTPAYAEQFEDQRSSEAVVSDRAGALAQDMLVKEQARRHAIDKGIAPIRSRGDLDQYLVSHEQIGSPLDALAPGLRRMFVASLGFNENGVTEFRYDVLETLSPTQIYKILALFGAQSFTNQLRNVKARTPLDNIIMFSPPGNAQGIDILMDYRCQSKGTCTVNNMKACTSNC